MKFPAELNFLQPYFLNPEHQYRKPFWLLSDFESENWEYSFNFKRPKNLSWRIQLDDGSLLTDSKNQELLRGFQYFLTGNTHRAGEGHPDTASIKSIAKIFATTTYIIDYFLISSAHFQLSRFGLSGITKGELMHLLNRSSTCKEASEWVYEWNAKLCKFCLELLKKTDPRKIQHTLAKKPTLSIVTNEQISESSLDIPTKLVPEIRAALFMNGLYISTRYGYTPSSTKISEIIYASTLRGLSENKPTDPILTFRNELEAHVRELSCVPIKNTDAEHTSYTHYLTIRKSLYNLGIPHELGLPAPSIEDLASIRDLYFPTANPGRFTSAPSAVVFSSLRNAIELHLNHGKQIVNGYCRIALACMRENRSLTSYRSDELTKLIGPHLTDLGVNQLGLSCRRSGLTHGAVLKNGNEPYFTNLRNNRGLIELLAVYIGATQVVVGGLAARRADELLELPTDRCLDESEQWLIFGNCKSTRHLYGLRTTEARPLEPIAVEMIKNLVRMQKILKRIGFIEETLTLFSTPNRLGAKALAPASQYSLDANFDLFCDYFQTEQDTNGRRYYLRQHQLRRFFAMLFFHTSSIGGLETLQWMLGQVELSHVWHYITESLSGAALRGAKAQYLAEKINKEGEENYKNLAVLIKERYGTDSFLVADTQELEDYLSDLLQQELIEVEPEFFVVNNKQHMRVILKVRSLTQCLH
ncbi:integrase [Pseudomonas oryzihabitans]|uniref:integrase n=1 Tax=Pseudomonas oryzihabitans TaxID=47885 RepID=UPI003D04FBE2